MRRIDARRGTENFKALFPTEFELLTKNHQGGPNGHPIRSRVNIEVKCEVKVRSKVKIWLFIVLGPGDQDYRS